MDKTETKKQINWLIDGVKFFSLSGNENKLYNNWTRKEFLGYIEEIDLAPKGVFSSENKKTINNALEEAIFKLEKQLTEIDYPTGTIPMEIVEEVAEVSEDMQQVTKNPSEEARFNVARRVKEFINRKEELVQKGRTEEGVKTAPSTKEGATETKATKPEGTPENIDLIPTREPEKIVYTKETEAAVIKALGDLDHKGPKEYKEYFINQAENNLPPQILKEIDETDLMITSKVTVDGLIAINDFYKEHGELPNEKINPKESLFKFVNPKDPELVAAIPNSAVRERLAEYALTTLRIAQHDSALAEGITSAVLGQSTASIIHGFPSNPREFTVSTEKSSKIENIRELVRINPTDLYKKFELYAEAQNTIIRKITNTNPELLKSLSSKSLEEMARKIVNSNAATERTLGFLFRTKMGGNIFNNPILGYSYGGFANFELAITSQEGVTMLGWGVKVGNNVVSGGLNLGTFLSSASKAPVAIEAATAGAVAGTAEGAAVGAAAGAAEGAAAGAAVGAAGGPLAIITMIIGAISGALIDPIIKWIQNHREDFVMLLMAPMVLAGMFISSPLLIGVGIAGGVGSLALKVGGKSISGGIGGAIKSITGTFTSVVVGSIGVPFLVACIGFPFLVALILFIINTGAYVVPPNEATSSATVESKYIQVIKTATPPGPFENDLSITVKYTIYVTAKESALSHIVFTYSCKVASENAADCPTPTDITGGGVTYADFSAATPTEILPGTAYVITYTATYPAGEYNDSAVTDVFNVVATSNGETTSAQGGKTIIIGKPPIACFDIGGGFPEDKLSNLLLAISHLQTEHTLYVTKLCSAYDTIYIKHWQHPSPGYWGMAKGNTILLGSNGLKDLTTAIFILAHETGHTLHSGSPEYLAQFENYPGIKAVRLICTYKATTMPEEAFAESIGLYAAGPEIWSSGYGACLGGDFPGKYPSHYQFVKDVIFEE